MAVFRGTDRIRKAAASAKGSLRHVRSNCLKGITIVEKKTLSLRHNWSAFERKYRSPIRATAIALVGVAAIAVIGGQYVKAHTTSFYQVYWNGKPVGNISSSAKVDQWLAAKAVTLDRADTPVREALDEGQVTYTFEKAYRAKVDDEATLAKLASQVTTHPVGVQLTVNGKVVGIVRDRAEAEELLAKIKNRYVPKGADVVQTSAKKSNVPQLQTLAFSTAAASQPTTVATADAAAPAEPGRLVTSVDFYEKVDIAEVDLQGEPKLSDPDHLYKKLATGNPAPVRYTVKAGDCIGCIADKMNVPVDLIYEKNPGIDEDRLQIGEVLDLTVLKPVLNVRSLEQVTQIEPIEAAVEYKTDGSMRAGETKVLRQGKDGRKSVTYRQMKKNGSLMEEEIVAQQVLEKAVNTIILKGTKVIAGEGTGKFMWPVSGHRITSYLGERWGRMHKGIDIVGRSSILAADNGVVEFAGYNSGGLGNAVIINHKNGFKTVYGHMKSVKVKKGQIVEKGETIGIMGSTGHSTGTHLHFEVYLDGKLKNPISFL